MKISKDYVKVETVKITDDYPPCLRASVPPWSPPEGGINIVYNHLHYQVNEGLCYDIIEKIMEEFKKIIKM